MALQFQGYGDPFARQKLEQQNDLLRFRALQEALGAVSGGINNYKQNQMRQSMLDMDKEKFGMQKQEFDRQNEVTPFPQEDVFASNSLTQKNPNRMSFPGAGQQGMTQMGSQMAMPQQQPPVLGMPQNKISLFQGGAQQPQMSSDIVAMHKKQFPNMSQKVGLPPPGYSPRTYAEELENQNTLATIGQKKASMFSDLRGPSAELPKQKEAPTGFRWAQGGSLEPIPGGPADLKSQSQKEKSDLAKASQMEKANLIINKIDQALSKVSPMSAGFGSLTKSIPMTPARNLSADLETIKALLGFEQLGEMKNQSRAGASGLGALSDREMSLLTSARANLDQAQGDDQLRERLNEVKGHFSNWVKMEMGINPYEQNSQQSNTNQPGKIRVRNKKTGQTGTISEQYFDQNKYERL